MANPNWQPGKSGNPSGRPPKSRALTEILRRAGGRMVEVNGEKISGRRLMARLLWQAAESGEVTLPSGEKLVFGPRDWFEVVKFLYQHIDGPPPQALDVTSGGQPLKVILEWESGGDSDG